MQRTGIYTYYVFGYNYCLLNAVGLSGRTRKQAKGMLDEFFASLDSLDLPVTTLVAHKLAALRLTLADKPDEIISEQDAALASDELDKIDPALDAEITLRSAYVLTKKRYPLETLLDEPLSLLGANAEKTLTETSKLDFALGCRQIALSEPTAAAFHLMRMLEEQVKVLYFAFKKTKHLEVLLWGPMTAQLKTKNAPKPSAKLLSHLDGMRQHFRNPTQHPELFYTLDEAEDLLSQTITAVHMIAAELPKPKA
jgi:hypothetical protein